MSPSKSSSSDSRPATSTNRQARFEYHIEYTLEAGLVLRGSEVKSLREGGVQLKEGYAHIKRGEVFLEGVYIKPYAQATVLPPDPVRSRKLLLNKHEIQRLEKDIATQGMTLIPLKVYFKQGRAKLELGVGRGKKRFDKRESIKERETQRNLARVHQRHRA